MRFFYKESKCTPFTVLKYFFNEAWKIGCVSPPSRKRKFAAVFGTLFYSE